MKKTVSILSIFMVLCLLITVDLDARGGRGGGFRGGGGSRGGGSRGGGRGGRSTHRSPSMSRSSRPRPASRPASRQRPARPSTSVAKQRPSRGPRDGRTGTRSDVQQFLRERPSGRPSQLPARGDGVGKRRDNARDIRNDIGKNRPGRGDWFNDDFWKKHNNRPKYYNRDRDAWRWATAAGVTGWLGWRGSPYYYDYYDDGWGYGSDSTYTEPDYTQQAQAIETATSEQASDEWMQLGVFALSKDEKTAATPNFYLQLAINKEGMIAGTYYNSTTDKTYEAEGLVDQESQRAAWKMSGSESAPIVETGIYNLTKEEVPIRIYFADGRTQKGMMTRLEEPQKQTAR